MTSLHWKKHVEVLSSLFLDNMVAFILGVLHFQTFFRFYVFSNAIKPFFGKQDSEVHLAYIALLTMKYTATNMHLANSWLGRLMHMHLMHIILFWKSHDAYATSITSFFSR